MGQDDASTLWHAVPNVKHSVPDGSVEVMAEPRHSLYGRDVTRAARPTPLPGTVRERLAQAAADLFESQGYDATTIDDIAVRAGIGRRTFFRYYRTKEDVIFPDHDELLAKVGERLSLSADETGLEAVLQAGRIGLRQYVEAGEISLMRHRLDIPVPAPRG